MFSVITTTGEIVFRSKNDIEAFQFALSLHQASNVPHTIRVKDPDDTEVAFLSKVE